MPQSSRRPLAGVRRRRSDASRREAEGALPGTQGTVLLPFGRYFAARADMLTRESFKTTAPIEGVSPISATGRPDPQMESLASGDRVNDRARLDIGKDLGERFSRADADYLVVDNSTSLLAHRRVRERWYTIVPGEDTSLMDALWNEAPSHDREQAWRLSHEGVTADVLEAYDRFLDACLAQFPPSRIILIRSHCARFWADGDGRLAPTNVDRRDAAFLSDLDDHFAGRAACRVVDAVAKHVPTSARWQDYDHRLRMAIEQELAELCRTHGRTGLSTTFGGRSRRSPEAADHVVTAARRGHPVDRRVLDRCVSTSDPAVDDLLALAYLDQNREVFGVDRDYLQQCVRTALRTGARSPLLRDARRFFRHSLTALRSSRGRAVRLPRTSAWTPQVSVQNDRVVVRFLGDGTMRATRLRGISPSEASGVARGESAITLTTLQAALASWPTYIERARHGICEAPRVQVADADELLDSCHWLDWHSILRQENVEITTPDHRRRYGRPASAKTDLSFLFDPDVRVCTVGGGLMDQLTHIALFDSLCGEHGLEYYLDDFRYAWWHSHNGFEADRLAPHLQRRRISRLVSQELVESFRIQTTRTRLPWVYSQSQAWFDFGLSDALVVTKDYFNSRRLVDLEPPFPVLVYDNDADLSPLMASPPRPLCFYTTQQRIPVRASSAEAIRRVFSFEHLLDQGLEPDVAESALLLRSSPHVAMHIRRGDYLGGHFDTGGWHAAQTHYQHALRLLIETELHTDAFDVAVFSDDLAFVDSHREEYGLDLVQGTVRFMRGNSHYRSIYDSYLMSLCPVIVGSVGSFSATTSLLADPPSMYVRARPSHARVEWRRQATP